MTGANPSTLVGRSVKQLGHLAESGADLIGANEAWRKKWNPKYMDLSFSLKAAIAEFFAMTLFVFLGCSTAVYFGAQSGVGNGDWESAINSSQLDDIALTKFLAVSQTASSWGIVVALAFGMGIAVLAYCVAHVSGGQINPVVSTCLFLTGRLGPVQTAANIFSQYVGAILGAAFVYGTTPDASNSALGANAVSPTFSDGNAVCGEIVMTALLVFTVLQTACEPRAIAKNMAPLAIGLSVFLGHCVLLPIDGCSINPARSFGPAAIAGFFRNFWVFNVGPWVGGLFGVLAHMLLWLDWDKKLMMKGKKGGPTNDVSSDNCGLNDDALRIR